MKVRELISEALVELGVLAANETATDADATTGLRALSAMILSLPSFGLGGALTDVRVTQSPHLAEPDTRVLWQGVGVLSLVLPDFSSDGRIDLRNGAIVSDASSGALWVWVSELGAWTDLSGLEMSTESPLGASMNQALISMLAEKLARRFQVAVDGALSVAAKRGENRVNAMFAPEMSANMDSIFWLRDSRFLAL